MSLLLFILPSSPSQSQNTGWGNLLFQLISEIPRNYTIILLYSSHTILHCSPTIRSAEYFGHHCKIINLKKSILYSIKSLIVDVIFGDSSLQSWLVTPACNDKLFQTVVAQAAKIVFVTSRTANSELLHYLDNYLTRNNIFFFLVDYLSCAMMHRADLSKLIVKRYAYEFESRRLYSHEAYIRLNYPTALANRLDDHELFADGTHALQIYDLVMKVRPQFKPSNSTINPTNSHKRIYILGNHNYLPNRVALGRLLSFFSANRASLCHLLVKHDISIAIVGAMSWSSLLKTKALIECLKLSNSIRLLGYMDDLGCIADDGIATLTAVNTTYGIQSKNIFSIGCRLPILRYYSLPCNAIISPQLGSTSSLLPLNCMHSFSSFAEFSLAVESLISNPCRLSTQSAIDSYLRAHQQAYSIYIQAMCEYFAS